MDLVFQDLSQFPSGLAELTRPCNQVCLQNLELAFQVLTSQVRACQQLVFLTNFGKIFQDIIHLAAIFSGYGINQVQTVFHLQEAVAIKVQVLQDIRQAFADVLDVIVGLRQLLGDFLVVLIVFFHRLHVVHGRTKVGEAGEILIFQHGIGIGQGVCDLLVVKQPVSLLK